MWLIPFSLSNIPVLEYYLEREPALPISNISAMEWMLPSAVNILDADWSQKIGTAHINKCHHTITLTHHMLALLGTIVVDPVAVVPVAHWNWMKVLMQLVFCLVENGGLWNELDAIDCCWCSSWYQDQCLSILLMEKTSNCDAQWIIGTWQTYRCNWTLFCGKGMTLKWVGVNWLLFLVLIMAPGSMFCSLCSWKTHLMVMSSGLLKPEYSLDAIGLLFCGKGTTLWNGLEVIDCCQCSSWCQVQCFAIYAHRNHIQWWCPVACWNRNII